MKRGIYKPPKGPKVPGLTYGSGFGNLLFPLPFLLVIWAVSLEMSQPICSSFCKMRPMIIGYKTSGELEEQPRDVNLVSPTSHAGSVLRKATGNSRSGMENSNKKSKTRMQFLELDVSVQILVGSGRGKRVGHEQGKILNFSKPVCSSVKGG